jgi:hypothetical protein
MILTANQKRAIRRLWKGDLTTQEICEEIGFTEGMLLAAAAVLNLPDRTEPDVFVPTQEMIRLECAKIRMTWTPAEREARLGRIMIGYQETHHARRNPPGSRAAKRSADDP